MNYNFNFSISKKQLMAVLGLSRTTFKRMMLEIEPELLKKFPHYNKRSSLLPPNQSTFIIQELGFDLDAFQKKYKSMYLSSHNRDE